MDYRSLGGTGVTVSHRCLGAMEPLTGLLAGQDIALDGAMLDRIDELVPPGTNINPVGAGWTSPPLDTNARRRR